MAVKKQSLPSFASVISVLSIVLYCAGFLRVELELNKHKERLKALENAVSGSKPPTSEPNYAKTTRNVPGKFVLSIENRFEANSVVVLLLLKSFPFRFNSQIQTSKLFGILIVNSVTGPWRLVGSPDFRRIIRQLESSLTVNVYR